MRDSLTDHGTGVSLDRVKGLKCGVWELQNLGGRWNIRGNRRRTQETSVHQFGFREYAEGVR